MSLNGAEYQKKLWLTGLTVFRHQHISRWRIWKQSSQLGPGLKTFSKTAPPLMNPSLETTAMGRFIYICWTVTVCKWRKIQMFDNDTNPESASNILCGKIYSPPYYYRSNCGHLSGSEWLRSARRASGKWENKKGEFKEASSLSERYRTLKYITFQKHRTVRKRSASYKRAKLAKTLHALMCVKNT